MTRSLTDIEIGAQAILWSKANPEYASVCRVFVASHYKYCDPDKMGLGKYDLSKDVTEVDAEDTFMGQTASLTILPRRPYQEWIFPGDWLSIYVGTGMDAPGRFGVFGDPEQEGDDVRIFWGFVDSVKESISVSEDGSAQVRIKIVCSGIQKALQRTMIYHNPMLSADTLFGAILPGMANLMKGLAMSGTPATIPRSIAISHLGFGGQFTMPDSYAELLPSDLTQEARVASILQCALDLERILGFDFGGGLLGKPKKIGLVERSLKEARKFTAKSIAQIFDLFSYVEDLYVDGRIINTPIHDLNGNIWQLMLENSNPILNECFVSLRPDIGGIFPSGKDEWGMSPAYVPALIIREKPFSWLDGRAFRYGGKGASTWTFKAPSKHGKHQDFPFADVAFSSWANPANSPVLQQFVSGLFLNQQGSASPVAGIKFSSEEEAIRQITLAEKLVKRQEEGRWVERVKLSNQDIFSETLGMSDTDHFNFIMISEANNVLSTQSQKFTLLQDGMVPTFLAESIKKYGLRVNELQTKFMYQGGTEIDSKGVMDFLIRTLLCWDMWFQHNPWYRSGIIGCKGIPKARAGMYLDIQGFGREESFYIEGVTQNWVLNTQTGTGHLFSSLTVTRGQPGLSNPDKRFLYAPQDPVQIFVGDVQIPRADVKGQPLTKRSPYSSEKEKIDKYDEIIKSFVISQPPTGYTNELFILTFELRNFEKYIKDAMAARGSKLTIELMNEAARKTMGNSTTDQLIAIYENVIKAIDMPPLYPQKEDRLKAGHPPWFEQESLRGEMWDPVARVGKDVEGLLSNAAMELGKK